MRGLLHALIRQKVGAPAPRLVQLPPSIEGHPVRIGDVRFKAGPIRNQNRRELTADFLGCGFDGVQPWKFTALKKLDRGKLGEIHESRLWVKASPARRQQIEAMIDAAKTCFAVLRANRR